MAEPACPGQELEKAKKLGVGDPFGREIGLFSTGFSQEFDTYHFVR